LAPAEPFVWWELGRAYMEMEQWRPAEEAVRKAVELDPENAQYLADLGRVMLKLGDREAAQEAIDHARELVPEDPEVQAAAALLQGEE
ncbi:MAG TPA: tetratricopeptide repeat protein, partial [Armatimonadota bacterium]|nr:tetratricopeptide repeat protein [Armatimonadota bacterium]